MTTLWNCLPIALLYCHPSIYTLNVKNKWLYRRWSQRHVLPFSSPAEDHPAIIAVATGAKSSRYEVAGEAKGDQQQQYKTNDEKDDKMMYFYE